MGECLLFALAGPLPLHEAIRIAPADLRSSIRAERVDHDDLVAPTQARQTILDALFFIKADDDGRHGGHDLYPVGFAVHRDQHRDGCRKLQSIALSRLGSMVYAKRSAMKTLDDVHQLPGMLSVAEVECLFRLGQFNGATGVIVEIGSWKGK